MVYGEAPWIFTGRALYQLQLVKTEEARKYIPSQFKLVELFGYTLGGFYLARYDDSPVGAFDELVAMAGLVWNPPTSCAWAARVYVNNSEARNHGLQHVGLPSRLATFKELLPEQGVNTKQDEGASASAQTQRSWWRQLHSPTGREQQLSGGTHPIQINNVDNCKRGASGRHSMPVCTLQLPSARSPQEFAGPRIRMALPSFSGATPACPELLKYACDLWTNVRFVTPAVVRVPPALPSTEKGTEQNPEVLSALLNGRPLLAMAFDNMEMTVNEPERLIITLPQHAMTSNTSKAPVAASVTGRAA